MNKTAETWWFSPSAAGLGFVHVSPVVRHPLSGTPFLLWSFQPLDITVFNVSASQDAKVPTSQGSTKATRRVNEMNRSLAWNLDKILHQKG